MFHHGSIAVLVAAARRSKAILDALQGDCRPEFWISECYGAQAGWATKTHQICLAHLIRDVQQAIGADHSVLGPRLRRMRKRAYAGCRKITNGFRQERGAHLHSDIRIVIETARRRSIRAIDAIQCPPKGEPLHTSKPIPR